MTQQAARKRAIEERIVAARREKLIAKPAEPPFVEVASASGFRYRVHLRGGADGPHSCDCPDFEANRLHTCKHVERIRLLLRCDAACVPEQHRKHAQAPRIYLRFGALIEPHLYGHPTGRGARAVRSMFNAAGEPLPPRARDEVALR
jgi:hypothetical protein